MSSSNLDTPYVLTGEQIDSYRKNGHVLLRGVCPPGEIAKYHAIIRDAVRKLNPETRKLEDRDTYGKAFLQTMNLWESEEAVHPFTLSKRFAGIAADLMGVDGVRLYHDQALYKEGGGGHTPWHQDQHYWPLATDSTITMWMPLIDVSAEMGTMSFASGSHKEGYLGDLEISDESEAWFEQFVKERGYASAQSGDMKAGDATFHSGWTLHGAPGNTTDTLREVMTIIYYKDGVLVGPVDNKNRQADLDRWLPEMKTGELAASRLNPVVYSR
jgi:ectoine hydroxylase-related dioxygenase (phytanoyl-CoA dioxygenase family)